MIDFFGKRRIIYAISLAIMIIGAVFIAINGGFVLDIQFQGGAVIEIGVPNADYDVNAVQNVLSDKMSRVVNAQKSTFNFDAREENNNSASGIYNLDIRVETDKILTADEINSIEEYVLKAYGNTEISQKEYSEISAPYVAIFNTKIPHSYVKSEDDFNAEVSKVEAELRTLLSKRVSTGYSYIYDPENYEVEKHILNLKIPTNSQISAEEIDEVKSIVSEKLDIVITDDGSTGFNDSNVSSSVGREMLRNSFYAIILASVLILIYVWFRFRTISGLSAGVSAVIALSHDAIIMIIVYGLLRYPINENFIAAVLTIIGYSINATIVIFDRVRENTAKHKHMKPHAIANLSVTQSLSRAINTTVCVLISLVVLYVIAKINQLSSMELFAFPLIIGMISGFYSSVFISCPLWASWQHKKHNISIDEKETV